jgi:hypothetical protein
MLRLYQGFLHLYPAAYRQEFGEEMQCVFLQAHAERSRASLRIRATFLARELSGLFSGAAQAHFLSLFGSNNCLCFRRSNMRPQFRFPRSTVFLMLVILAGVMLTIQQAKIIQMPYGPHGVMAVWNSLPLFLFIFPALACAAIVAFWGVLFALHRTGMHRLESMNTWPGER